MRDLLDMDMCPRSDADDCISLDDMPVAYSYVPYQKFEQPYEDKEKAHKVGTVFPSLNLPYGVYGNEFKTRKGVGLK